MIPGGTVISVVAVLLSIWLLSNSTYYEARDSAIVIVVGFLIYFIYRTLNRKKARDAV